MNDNGNDNISSLEEPSQSHLSDEQLSAYLDDSLAPPERALVSAHLSTCARCSEELRRLRATAFLLRSLPEPRPARSFQLSPDFARTRWRRLGISLAPAIPVLRVATVFLVLVFAAVSTRNLVVDDQSSPASVAPS